MPSNKHRRIVYLFFGYFLAQIPSTLVLDTQGVYSEWLYPSWMKSIRDHYLETYRDPFLADAWKYPWYLSFCFLEHFIGMPFFCWAAYSYYYGALARPRIIIPAIIYSTHTLTAIIAMSSMAMLGDFSQTEELAPRTFGERLKLCSAFAIFFIITLTNLIDSFILSYK